MYLPFDLVEMITSSPNYDSVQLLQSLPKGCSTTKDHFLVVTYRSPLFFHRIATLFDVDSEIDYSNILLMGNATGEVQMNSADKEFENLKQNCLIQ